MNWNEIFYIDNDGNLIWRISRGTVKAGDIAGTINKKGYWQGRYKGKKYYVHRIIWEMYYGKISQGCEIDHNNRNPSDNRVKNLELTDATGNNRNRSKRNDNTSGDTGVQKITNGQGLWYWQAQWCDENGKHPTKAYRIDMHGNEEAYRLAKEYRAARIAEIGGYSGDHGT